MLNLGKIKIKRAHKKSDKLINSEVKSWYNNLVVKRKLSKTQKKEIRDYFYQLTGKKISLISHEYFYSRTGVYSREYIPKDLYINDIQPKANNIGLAKLFGDKNMADILLPKQSQPRSILKNIDGCFYFDGKPVTKEVAIEKCQDIGDVVIKPSGMSQGKGVKKIFVQGGNVDGQEPFASLLQSYGKDFIIQETVRQHKDMSSLNPTSVNTIRILTYRSDNNEVLHIYSVVRIGKKGSVIDNQCAGGISTVVGDDGRLGKYAFGGYVEDNVTQTDTGMVLGDFIIPSYDKALDFVKDLHLLLPYFRLIGWDVAIGEDGNPVLIEFNTRPQLSQSAFGPGFGKYTERIIREIWNNKNTKFAY